jgi:hypothetical protein
MANHSPSLKRSKPKLEPISLDELAGDSTMTGFSDLFKIPTTAPMDPQIEASFETSPPVIGPVAPSVSGRAEIDGAETGGPVSVASPVLTSFPLERKLQIREAKSVQDGHTYGEQVVYEALWKYATVVSQEARMITIGFLRMTSIAGLAESNCKTAMAGLVEKLSIERLPDTNLAQGRNYKIYSEAAVLARRREAGLTYVVKSRGVVFVDPQTGAHLTTAKTPARRRQNNSTNGPHPAETSGPVSISQIARLAFRLRSELDPTVDDTAAALLWRQCQTSVPDCSIEEIVHFALLKKQELYQDPNARNPLGLLLMTFPEIFGRDQVDAFRLQKGREAQQRNELQRQQQKYWRTVVDNPETPSAERNLALKFLADLGENGSKEPA